MSRSTILRSLITARDVSTLVAVVLSVIIKELSAKSVIDL